jgi:hypothetical protein
MSWTGMNCRRVGPVYRLFRTLVMDRWVQSGGKLRDMLNDR